MSRNTQRGDAVHLLLPVVPLTALGLELRPWRKETIWIVSFPLLA